MKNIFKDLLFLLIFGILLYFCSNIMVLKGNGYGSDVTSFYNIPNNTLELMFFGSSHSYSTFSPEVIKEKTDLDSYNFATQQQPIYITYHYMIEALKTQKPKYFVLEIRMLAFDEEYAKEGVVRDALDKMKFSFNKINAVNTSVEKDNNRMSYYLNIIKYHSRYNELTMNDFTSGLTQKGIKNYGFKYLDSNNDIVINNEEFFEIDEMKELPSKNLEYFKKIVKLTKDNDIELILVKSPCKLEGNDMFYYNWVFDYASENDLKYIDYNKKVNELDIGIGDYYDNGHLSGIGAEKVSVDFSEFLNNLG